MAKRGRLEAVKGRIGIAKRRFNGLSAEEARKAERATGILIACQAVPQLQPKTLPGFQTSLGKVRAFVASKYPFLNPKAGITADSVLKELKGTNEGKELFLDFSFWVGHFQKETNFLIGWEEAYALIKAVWLKRN
jgi:hypothetical protein